jgi:hypothetical protein
VHVWDYDFPFSPSGTAPWPQFHQNARRTGSSEPLGVLDVDPPLAGAPRVLELSSPHPNPAHGACRFAFGVPAELAGRPFELAVYDLAGRRVRILESGPARPGRSEAQWDLRDALGGRLSAGLYLVRLGAGGWFRTAKVAVLE